MKGFRVEYFVFRVFNNLEYFTHKKKHLKNLELVMSSEEKTKPLDGLE